MIDGDELGDTSNRKTEDAAAVLKVRPKSLPLLPLEGAHDPARTTQRATSYEPVENKMFETVSQKFRCQAEADRGILLVQEGTPETRPIAGKQCTCKLRVKRKQINQKHPRCHCFFLV